jgi:hypothetical protein
MRTAAFLGAEVRNPNLEIRDKLKFPIFQCPKLAAGNGSIRRLHLKLRASWVVHCIREMLKSWKLKS